MVKPYEAPKLLVGESEIHESIAAGIASAVTASATSSMTSCSLHNIDSKISEKSTTFKFRPIPGQTLKGPAVDLKVPAKPK